MEKHIREYGRDVTTEIIKECYSTEELSYWGRYYSNLWKITTAMDDYGSRIWANRIPETGSGPGITSKISKQKFIDNPLLIAQFKEVMSKPEVKRKRVAAIKRKHLDPKFKKKFKEKMKEVMNKTETKLKLKAAQKEAQNRPEVRAKNRGWLSNVILGHRKTIKGWKVAQ